MLFNRDRSPLPIERLEKLERSVRMLQDDVPDVVKATKEVAKLRGELNVIRNLVDQEIARLDTAIHQVRGVATGGQRGKRGQTAELAETGRIWLEAVQSAQAGDPTRLQAILEEVGPLASGGAPNGAVRGMG